MKKTFTLVALVATAVSVAAAPALELKTLPNFGTEKKTETELKAPEMSLFEKFSTPRAITQKAVADDATIDITVASLTDSSAVATITPTDLTAGWYVTYSTAAEYKILLDSLGDTKGVIDHYINTIDAEIQLTNMFVGFFGGDSAYISDYTQIGTKDTLMKVLAPKTAYTVLAFYVDTLANAYCTNYKLATAEFTTNNVTPSENVITLEVKNDTLHIATTNADKYLLWVAHKDSLDELLGTEHTINDYLDVVGQYCVQEDYLEQVLYSGNQNIAISALMSTFYNGDGNYVAIVAPFTERGYRNGDAQTTDFSYTKPAPTTYNITLEKAVATNYGYDEFTGLFEIQTVFYQHDEAATPYLTFDLYAAANQSLVGNFTVEDNTLYTGLETSWVTLETGDEYISDGEINIELIEKHELTATYKVSGYVALANFTTDTCRFSGTIEAAAYNSDGSQIELERKAKAYDVTLTKGIGTTYGYDEFTGLYELYFSFYQGNDIKLTPNFTFTLYAETENSLVGNYSVADGTLYSYYGTSYITFDSGDENVADGDISITLKEKKGLAAIYDISGCVVANNGDTCNLSGTIEATAYNSDDEQIELEPTTALHRVNADASVWAADGRVYADGELKIYDLLGRDVTTQNGALDGIYVVKSDKGVTTVVVRK